MSLRQRIDAALVQRRAAGEYRTRVVTQRGGGRFIEIDGRRYLNFASNDYLGLSRDPEVIRAWQQGAERYGVGSTASGHITGHTQAHQAVEEELAQWLGYPRALLFISGYAANQALISALMQRDDRILADRLSHASLLEAALHSPATLRRFRHNDPQALATLLASSCSGQTLVVTEGIFSMDGDRAPLAELHQRCREAESWLLVDDAHGIGVSGEQGRGSCWQQRVRPEILIVTFGKAFGVGGAAILCDTPLAEYLLQFARHLIYSTAMPPAQAVALSAALRRIQRGDVLRACLSDRITQFRRGAETLPYRLGDSRSAIQPLLIGDNAASLRLAERLRRRGIWVTAIRPPTVPPGSARLRLALSAVHEEQDIRQLLEVLHESAE